MNDAVARKSWPGLEPRSSSPCRDPTTSPGAMISARRVLIVERDEAELPPPRARAAAGGTVEVMETGSDAGSQSARALWLGALAAAGSACEQTHSAGA